jgi:signal transduction histidine kinase
MRWAVDHWHKDRQRIILNPHFWSIVFIILIVFLTYYHIDNNLFLPFDPRETWLWNLLIFEFNHDFVGSLFIIPFIYSAVVFFWQGTLFTWVITMVFTIPRIIYYSPDSASFMTNIVFLLLPLLIILVLATLREWRRAVRKAAIEKERERQAYVAQVFKAQEEERKRISREIHDDTIQRLWIVANDIQRLAVDRLSVNEPQAASKLVTIRDTILGISDDAKKLSLALRRGILDELGLLPAIRYLVDQTNNEGSIEVMLEVLQGEPRKLDLEASTHLFQIAQEALNNARKHSNGTKIIVCLEFNPEAVKMTIKDNGKGFSVQDVSRLPSEKKLGIFNMEERAKLLNGTFKIDSVKDKGTIISIEFKDKL